MEDWKEYNLGELIELKNGVAFKSSEFVDHGVPVIKIKNVKPNRILVDDLSYVSQETSLNKRCFDILPTDILITMTGNRKDGGADSWVGKVALFNQTGRYLLNQRVSAIRVKDNRLVDNVYLSYLLSSWDAQLYFVNHSNSSGGQANISPDVVYNYPVALPPLSVQLEIASILKSLDEKIECNRRINENLEQQAQALFKSWFVDFEPFKDQPFVESELGMIPEGWRVAKIKDIPHTLNTGKRPKGGAIASGVPSIGAEQLKGLCNYDYAKTKYISKEYSQSIPKGKVIGYEVYLNRVGGKPGDYIQNTTMFGEGYPYENCYINDHVFKLDFMQNRGYNVYIYFTFLTSRIKKYLNACGGKAAIPVINKQNIDDIYVFLPENEYVIKFGKSVLPIMNIIFKNGLESARLAELRDTLLPKLMSGDLKVGEINV